MGQYKEAKQINGVVLAPINSNKTTLASARIARFLATYFKIPLIDLNACEKLKTKEKLEYVFLVNANFGFSREGNFLPTAINLLKECKYPIYVNNDYVLTPPGQIMKEFRPRKFIWWSSVPETKGINVKKTIYVNWNKLTYERNQDKRKVDFNKIIYWGAYRKKRASYFKHYLNHPKVSISTTSRAKKDFENACPAAKILPPFENLSKMLNRYQATIYLEDNTGGHLKYCSPANRFYEALGAGLPILFQSESINTFKWAGYDIKPYIVDNVKELAMRLKNAEQIRKEQSKWCKDYVLELTREIDYALVGTKL